MEEEDYFEDDGAVELHLVIDYVRDGGKSKKLQLEKVKSNDLVKALKEKLAESTEVKKGKQFQLIYDGKILQDDFTLYNSGITKSSARDDPKTYVTMIRKSPMSFCPDCQTLLTPTCESEALFDNTGVEHHSASILVNKCSGRDCEYSTPALNRCVFRMKVSEQTEEEGFDMDDLATDPTLPRKYLSEPCRVCGGTVGAYLQSPVWTYETGLKMFCVCINCHNHWVEGKKERNNQ